MKKQKSVSSILILAIALFGFYPELFSQTQVGLDINGEAADDGAGWSIVMPDAQTIAVGAVFNSDNGTWSGHVRVYTLNSGIWTQKGSDIDGEFSGDFSGYSLSMPDENTIAIGAPKNDGNGIDAGQVRIFSWNGNLWTQKGSNINGEAADDWLGQSVSMPDENTVAIGAPHNDGNGIDAGHVRIYSWNGANWIQIGNDIDGENSGDQSGRSLYMPDVSTIAIGAPANADNGTYSGHVRVYSLIGSIWTQKGLDIDGEAMDDFSGSVSMADTNTLIVGAPGNDNAGSEAGHARVYEWNGANWIQKGNDVDGQNAGDAFGSSVNMPDPNTIAIGAPGSSGNGTGTASGQVKIYEWLGSNWIQKGSDIDGESAEDWSGYFSLCMPDNNTIAIGGYQNDGNGPDSGHARVFTFTSNLGLEELYSKNKLLLKITDVTGRLTAYKPNTMLFYNYSDGSIEKVFRID